MTTDKIDFEELERPKRSTFLTVLCILSFVGSSYAILSSAASLTFFQRNNMRNLQQTQQRSIEQMKDNKSFENGFAKKMLQSSISMMDPEKIKLATLGHIVAGFLTLAGAFIMFKRNVVGYGVYILGCIVGIAVPLYVYGTDNFASTLTASFVGFFSVVFIILYGMCVKEMLAAKTVA